MSNSAFILQGNARKFERRIKSLLEVTFMGFSMHCFKCFKDFKIGSKVRETLNGLVTICHPFSYCDLEMIKVCYRACHHHLVLHPNLFPFDCSVPIHLCHFLKFYGLNSLSGISMVQLFPFSGIIKLLWWV